jgi:hypothetical protein
MGHHLEGTVMVTIPDWDRKSPYRRKGTICKSLIVGVFILGNMTPGLDIGLWCRDSDPGGASRSGWLAPIWR